MNFFFKTAAEEPNKSEEVAEAQQEEAQQDSGALDIQQPSEELPAQLLQVDFLMKTMKNLIDFIYFFKKKEVFMNHIKKYLFS